MLNDFLNYLYHQKVDKTIIEEIPHPSNIELYKKSDIIEFLEEEELQNFENNKKSNFYRKNPPNDIFLNRDVTYILNDFGFRTWEDFTEGGEVNIFLGCSHTFGYGMFQEYTWPFKLNEFLSKEDKKKYKYWNLSTPGSSVETQFRMLYQILEKYGDGIKINKIFHFLPYYARYEYFVREKNPYLNNTYRFSPYIISPHSAEKYYKPSMIKDSFSDSHISLRLIQGISAIDGLARKYNSQYYITSFEYLMDNNVEEYFTDFMYDNNLRFLLARDRTHISYYDNHKIFSYFSQNMN